MLRTVEDSGSATLGQAILAAPGTIVALAHGSRRM